jgi:uncharacterized membrane protein YqhA
MISLMFLNSVVVIFIGVYKSIKAYMIIAQGRIEERPGILIAESLDSFLVALFLFIFAIGMSKLFLPKSNLFNGYDLPWLKIENFSHLKYILWEVLLTSLFVFFITGVVVDRSQLEWTHLVMPASIVMLAFAYKLFKEEH